MGAMEAVGAMGAAGATGTAGGTARHVASHCCMVDYKIDHPQPLKV